MPLSRSNRMDRRRYMLREAAADEPEYSPVRSKRRRSGDDPDEAPAIAGTIRKDAGYSQAVRRACQQRLVQLIPVRRSSLALVIAICWICWAALLGAHYWVHGGARTTQATLPISFLVHIRSPHGLAYWLGTQLWMMTALAGVMIFQLRRHKLDDYSATYRVWWAFIAAALFASFDSTSQALFLLGESIDVWARREIGYSGWSLVLASFAVVIGGLALRLCNELKEVPLSAAFWMSGLAAWGVSALLGTKLIITQWSPVAVDLVIGGCWLGGILSVWLAAGIYLRSIYIQAQKRFILRGGMYSRRVAWKMPRLKLPTVRMPWKHQGEREDEDVTTTRKTRVKSRNAVSPISVASQRDALASQEDSDNSEDQDSIAVHRPKTNDQDNNEKRGWKLWGTRATTAQPEDDAEPKKSLGWFGRKARDTSGDAAEDPLSRRPQKSKLASSSTPATASGSDPKVAEGKRSWWKRDASPSPDSQASKTRESQSKTESSQPVSQADKKSWWNRKANSKTQDTAKPQGDRTERTARSERPEQGSARTEPIQVASKFAGKISGWMRRSAQQTEGTAKPETPLKAKKTAPVAKVASEGGEKKKGLFGFMDALKLKPPTESESTAGSAKPSNPASRQAPLPSTVPIDDVEDDDDDDDYRHLSKAERKKQRREQRRAA